MSIEMKEMGKQSNDQDQTLQIKENIGLQLNPNIKEELRKLFNENYNKNNFLSSLNLNVFSVVNKDKDIQNVVKRIKKLERGLLAETLSSLNKVPSGSNRYSSLIEDFLANNNENTGAKSNAPSSSSFSPALPPDAITVLRALLEEYQRNGFSADFTQAHLGNPFTNFSSSHSQQPQQDENNGNSVPHSP